MAGSLLSYNIDDGYLDGIIRGYKRSLLTTADYSNLTQCDHLEDMKLHLATTDYGAFLQNEPSPLATSTIQNRCTERMVADFEYVRSQAVEPVRCCR